VKIPNYFVVILFLCFLQPKTLADLRHMSEDGTQLVSDKSSSMLLSVHDDIITDTKMIPNASVPDNKVCFFLYLSLLRSFCILIIKSQYGQYFNTFYYSVILII